MIKVVSLLSKERFKALSPAIPEGLNILFPEKYTESDIIKVCEEADCLFSAATAGAISAFILDRIPRIKIVQSMGVGYDHIDISASIDVGIPVANMPGVNSASVAEYVIGSLIALQRRLLESDLEIKAGNYPSLRYNLLREGLREVNGSKIGLIGFGDIARQVATMASMLGASVSYYATRQQPPVVEQKYSVEYKPLDELLATSDVVSLHIPLNDKTRNLIGARELALMPKGSILINSARGEVLNSMSLAEALENGHLAGAAIDTFAPEPPDPDHPFLTLSEKVKKRLLLSPHCAGVTRGANKRMVEGALENMARVGRGEVPQNIVNGIYKRS